MASLDRAVALAEVDARGRAASNSTWISTCRAPSRSRSRINRSSPNAAAASRRAAASASRQPRGLANDAHALAASAGRRLDQERERRLRRAALPGPRPTGPPRRSPRAPARRVRPPAVGAAALSPIARIARRRRTHPDRARPPTATPRTRRSRRGTRSPGGRHRRPMPLGRRGRRPRRRADRGRPARPSLARSPGSRGVRRCVRPGRTISPRLAMKTDRMGTATRFPASFPARRWRQTRQSRHLRRASARQRVVRAVDQLAIQRWTERVVGADPGGGLARAQLFTHWCRDCRDPLAGRTRDGSSVRVRRPGRAALLVERAKALLGLGAGALPGDHPRGVPLR